MHHEEERQLTRYLQRPVMGMLQRRDALVLRLLHIWLHFRLPKHMLNHVRLAAQCIDAGCMLALNVLQASFLLGVNTTTQGFR